MYVGGKTLKLKKTKKKQSIFVVSMLWLLFVASGHKVEQAKQKL